MNERQLPRPDELADNEHFDVDDELQADDHVGELSLSSNGEMGIDIGEGFVLTPDGEVGINLFDF